jgi:hypothetical protein
MTQTNEQLDRFMAEELLDLRKEKRLLIENSERLVKDNERMCKLIGRNTDEQKHIEQHIALMKQVKGE